jgi:hypothetical protein
MPTFSLKNLWRRATGPRPLPELHQIPLHRLDGSMSDEMFREFVDTIAQMFQLDPQLPELVELKADAERIIKRKMHGPRLLQLLRELHPQRDSTDGRLIIPEVPLNVLSPWSIARAAFDGPLDDEINEIYADSEGVHLHHGMRALVTMQAGAINPKRFNDQGERYRNACTIIERFTGLQIDPTRHVGRTSVMRVVREPVTGEWRLETRSLP